jgi:hypothetical protein
MDHDIRPTTRAPLFVKKLLIHLFLFTRFSSYRSYPLAYRLRAHGRGPSEAQWRLPPRYVTSVSYVCCKNRSWCCTCCNGCTRMLQASIPNVSSVFLDVRRKCAYLNVAYASHIYCKSMFEMFQLLQSYVAVSIFILQVTIVLSGCCIYFTPMLQVYHPNVSSAPD